MPKPALRLEPTTPKPQPPSLLLIFAESLEATFSRKDIFGEDLTPHLTALTASAKQFTGMRQISLTAWTTGAMVAAECASPLSAGGQWQDLLRNIATGVSPEMEGATCLGDVLAAHGYNTVLMTGADVNFGGKGTPRTASLSVWASTRSKARAGAAAQQTWGRERGVEDRGRGALRVGADQGGRVGESGRTVRAGADHDRHPRPSGFPSASCGESRGMIDVVRLCRSPHCRVHRGHAQR